MSRTTSFRTNPASGDKHAMFSVTLDGAAVKVEVNSRGWDEMILAGVAQLGTISAAGTESADIDCSGKSTIVMYITLSASNTAASVRYALKETNGKYLYSSAITVVNTGISDGGGRFLGEAIFLVDKTLGASNFKLRVETISNGNISITAAAV